MTFVSYSMARDVGVVRGEGRFDFVSADEFRDAVAELLECDQTRIVVDLGGVTFLDPSGVGALIHGRRTAQSRGGDLWICGAAPQAAMLLNRFNLDTLFPACTTVDAAYVD